MTNPIVTVIPFNTGTAALAERLIDWIFQLSGKKASGHVLLVSSHDVHAESRTKIQVSAELAFEGVSLIVCPPPDPDTPKPTTNDLWRYAAQHCASHYRVGWLWLDPTDVPVKSDWREQLAELYSSQPKRYLANRIKAGERLVLAKTAVYPPGAIQDCEKYCQGEPPFWMVAPLLEKATITRRIQAGRFEPEKGLEQVREDALLFCSDPSGSLIEMLRASMVQSDAHNVAAEGSIPSPATIPESPPVVLATFAEATPPAKRKGRPPKVKVEEQVAA